MCTKYWALLKITSLHVNFYISLIYPFCISSLLLSPAPTLVIIELETCPGSFPQRNFHCSNFPSRRLTQVIVQRANIGVKSGGEEASERALEVVQGRDDGSMDLDSDG